MDFNEEISDDDYEEFSEFDEYMNSLSESEYEEEVKWVEAIALAITQGKNVVKNSAELYDFRM
jgi:hypothetical protein